MMEDYQYLDDPDNLDLSRANVDDDDEEKEISPSTKEAATAAKAGIERFYKNLFKSIGERELRRVRYEQKMDQLGLSEEEREGRRKKLDQIETQFLRARRIRLTKDTFQTIKVIGRGSFGEVRLVRMRGTKKLYAMKKLKKSKMIERNQVAHVQNERDALAYLNDFYKQNLWVVRLYYSFQDAIYLYLVMEYAPGGDLMTTLMKYEVFTEEEARFYAAEIVLAVESIHKFDYIHRDIKPDNILLDKNGHIKLSDFGLCTGLTTDDRVSKFQNKYQQYLQQESESSSEHKPLSNSGNNNNTNTVDKKDKDWYSSINSDRFNSWKQKRRVLAYSEVGTPDYMAPEVLNPDGTGYGKEADWWSVGVILFEMMAGFPVFFSESGGGSDSTIRKIINWKQTLDEVFNDVDLSPEAQDLIRRLLTDRKERLGTGGADEIKRHPFFKDIDWDDIRAQQAPIVPRIEHPLDTSNFPVDDPDRFSDSEEEPEEDNEVKEEAESRREIDSKYPIFRGRRLRQTDIPFIGFTYKNLAAVPSLINRPPTPPHMRK